MPVPDEPVDLKPRMTLREEAYHAIKAAILNGKLDPGERIDDIALQQWLSTSRTPIREALTLLAAEGLVDLVPQKGAHVVCPDPQLAREEIQALGALMSSVIGFALLRLEDSGLSAVLTRLESAARAVESQDPGHTIASIQVFHETLVMLCPNAAMRAIANNALTRLGFHLRASMTEGMIEWGLLGESYVHLQNALTQRDIGQCRRIIEEMHFVEFAGSTS